MIINQDTQEVQNLGQFKSTVFTLKPCAKAFHIFIKSMYSNPVKSVLCELAQNAYDSMVKAGKGNQPITVVLPSLWDCNLKVIDSGVGMSPEFMMTRYAVALDSTKDDDANAAGGWGLGRCAALSLSSTYTVISVFDGVCSHYSVFVNNDGSPEIVLVNQEPALGQSNGVEVTVPVLSEHIGQFLSEAYEIFRYWTIKPIVQGANGFAFPVVESELSGDGWQIIKNSYSDPVIVAGIYCYPISKNDIPGLTSSQSALLESPLVLTVGPSDVSPQTNRQGLTYDNKTCQTIKLLLDRAVGQINASIQSEFNKCTNMMEARLLYHRYFGSGGTARNIGKLLGEKYKVVWNGFDIDSSDVDIEPDTGVTVTLFSSSYRRRGKYKTIHTQTPSLLFSPKATFFINDLPNSSSGMLRRMRYWTENKRLEYEGSSRVAFVVAFSSPSARSNFIQTTGLNPDLFKSVNAIDVPKTSCYGTSEHNPKHSKRVFQFSYQNGGRNSDSWETKNININQGGVYINIEKFEPVRSRRVTSNYSLLHLLNYLIEINLWDKDDVLVGVKVGLTGLNKESREIVNNPNWVHLDTYIDGLKDSIPITSNEIQQWADYKNYDNLNSVFKSRSSYFADLIAGLPSTHPIVEFIDILSSFSSDENTRGTIEEKFEPFTKLNLPRPFNDVAPSTNLQDMANRLNERYPLLSIASHISSWEITDFKQHFADYVNGVDQRILATQSIGDQTIVNSASVGSR